MDNISKESVLKDLTKYREALNILAGDMPIQCLCLPKPIENVLIKQDLLRVYDLLRTDLAKVKGLGKTRVRHLTSCLQELFSIPL